MAKKTAKKKTAKKKPAKKTAAKKKGGKKKAAKKKGAANFIISKSRTKAAAGINVSSEFYSALDDAARGKALAAWHAEWQSWVAWVAGNFTTTA